jgi:LysR family glycine cleavage system transcriptional activator
MIDVDWHKLPPLTTLRAFEATARLNGYSAAARSLNVTPAAIAQQVRKLETEIGASLVRREGRGLALTDAGRQLAGPLHEAFALIVKGIDDLQLQQSARGVRVSTTDYFGKVVILPSLGTFWNLNPTVQVSLSPEANMNPVDLENFDVTVRGAAKGKSWQGCQEIPLIETPFIICAAPSLLKSGDVDLSSLPWIQDRGIGGSVFRDAVRQVGCDPEQIQMVDPGSAIFELEAALMGYGLILGPELTLQNNLANGTLVRLETPLRMTGVYYAIFRKGPLAEPVRLFLDWLVALSARFSKA